MRFDFTQIVLRPRTADDDFLFRHLLRFLLEGRRDTRLLGLVAADLKRTAGACGGGRVQPATGASPLRLTKLRLARAVRGPAFPKSRLSGLTQRRNHLLNDSWLYVKPSSLQIEFAMRERCTAARLTEPSGDTAKRSQMGGSCPSPDDALHPKSAQNGLRRNGRLGFDPRMHLRRPHPSDAQKLRTPVRGRPPGRH